MPNRSQVVIIGAGFAGLNAAKSLKNVDVDVTIVDRRNFHLFQPLLYQVASAALNPSDIAYPIRSVFRGQANVRQILLGDVVGIDLEQRKISLNDGSRVSFDYLIVATGATHSYFGNEQFEEHAPGLKTIEDALYIRRRILSVFEKAEKNPEAAEELLTFVVVGAGPTGVEMAGAITEIAIHSMEHEFKNIDPKSARVILVEGAPYVLPVYPESLSEKAKAQLESLGVEVITDSLVEVIDDTGVTLKDGTRIESETVLWAAGVKASPLGQALGVELDKTGRVIVEDDLSVPGHRNVFVLGDLAKLDDVPGVAPAAMQMGRHAAKLIRSDLNGKPRKPFRYKDKGSLATIGRARGVADFGTIKFSGFLAWFSWLAIHIWYLIGFRNKLVVLISWAWAYISFRRGARIITGQPRPD
ncbi:MAG: NAD(P)/FAD-dependent oxidoreductase [Actinobacteria bacterium]|nr:MAG: NAD(P)/FAD-dependent oxidoreductase [Actinomycetota bacterium]